MARLSQPVGHQEAQMGPCAWTHFSSWTVWAGQCRRWTQGFQGVCSPPHIQSQQNTDPQYFPYILPSLPLHASGTFYLSGFQSWGRPSRQAPCLELGQTGTTESQSWKKPPQRPRPPRPLSPDENSEAWGHPWGRSWQRPRIPTPAWPALPSLLEARGWVRTGGRQSWKHPSLSGWAVPLLLSPPHCSLTSERPLSRRRQVGQVGQVQAAPWRLWDPGTTPAEENGGELQEPAGGGCSRSLRLTRLAPPLRRPCSRRTGQSSCPCFLTAANFCSGPELSFRLPWLLLPCTSPPRMPWEAPRRHPAPDAVFAARRRERMGCGLHPGLQGCSSCPPSGV